MKIADAERSWAKSNTTRRPSPPRIIKASPTRATASGMLGFDTGADDRAEGGQLTVIRHSFAERGTSFWAAERAAWLRNSTWFK
jgi:hypothetical protein